MTDWAPDSRVEIPREQTGHQAVLFFELALAVVSQGRLT